ncbi:MAG: type II secretion system protein [bacterium]|nr:type II secretion system protein [bacterium]
MKRKTGFTLAEVLITLAIIGVVAAVSIPSVISNSQQQEFKTGLRKAVSVLNSAITMNMALDGETPYDNSNLMGYLMKHMAIIETQQDRTNKYWISSSVDGGIWPNAVFYTTDGMRFEFWRNGGATHAKHFKHTLYESPEIRVCIGATALPLGEDFSCGGCGALGLNNNQDNTTKPPCMIMVDVNGDKKPNPANVNCKNADCAKPFKFSDPDGKKLTDLYTIMITDKEAIPYGVAAQRAMYNSQK